MKEEICFETEITSVQQTHCIVTNFVQHNSDGVLKNSTDLVVPLNFSFYVTDKPNSNLSYLIKETPNGLTRFELVHLLFTWLAMRGCYKTVRASQKSSVAISGNFQQFVEGVAIRKIMHIGYVNSRPLYIIYASPFECVNIV
jgi:hypothetical protein